MKISQTINFSGEPIRLDKYMAQQFPDIPRRFFQMQIEAGNILVNGKQKTAGYRLKNGDTISVNAEYAPQEISLEPQPEVDFKVLFHNDDFAIIEKPAGLTVHPSATQPKDTLVNGLLHRFPQIKDVGDDPVRPGIVHRLDKDTSGLMVVALNRKSFEYLKRLFQSRQVEKKYQALVWGHLKEKEGVISSYIGRSKTNPLKQASVKNPTQVSNAKEATTCYYVLEEYNDTSLVEAVPKTGRMHQIRIHFASLGHPLVGDKKYESRTVKKRNPAYGRHLLHAVSLKFAFMDGKTYEYSSQPPAEFEAGSIL